MHLGRHNSNELHYTIHSDIPFFGEDIGPISFRDWMWDTEKLVQPLFSKYSQFDILRHVTSRFIGRASEWWQKRDFRVQKGRESCINTFYELKAYMWKRFIPPSFRITREQQARLENFIDIGDAFIQNHAKFSRLGKDFKHNLNLLLSEQRKKEKHKKEQSKHKKLREYEKKREKEDLEKICAKREQEEKEIKERKKRYEEVKAKEENFRKAKEENERKEFETREKIRQESVLEIQSQVVELKSISKEKKELSVRDLVINPSPIPYMKIPFPKGVLPSLNSSHSFIKSYLFPSQTFCSPSLSLISSSSTYCTKIHFDFKIVFKNHLSQNAKHSLCAMGWISPISTFNNTFSHIFQEILLYSHYDFNAILFDDYYKYVFDPDGLLNLVAVSFTTLVI